uniref:Uncharacterized protein n=1 Tax=Rhizophora mucronata TaxID=61149 RepID=A0A2P2NDD0_RHIMU
MICSSKEHSKNFGWSGRRSNQIKIKELLWFLLTGSLGIVCIEIQCLLIGCE